MRLDALLLRLRPRLRYEAVDAGLLLTRRWWLPLTLLCALPVGLLLLVALTALDSAIAGLMLLWWLKPLCERLPLWYLSRAVFGEAPRGRDLFGSLSRPVWRHLFATLTWRRFSVSRSYEMPVVVLEGLRGGERRRRTRLLLAGRNAGAASWLTLWLVHVEMVVQIGCFALLYVLMPARAGMDFQGLTNDPRLQLMGYALAVALVMPFYVGGGFALYLNQRILLEGWDLEVAFRRLATRLGAPVLTLVAPGFALAALLGFAVLSSPPLQAAETIPVDASDALERRQVVDPDAARELVLEVLRGPDFVRQETRRVPSFLHERAEPAEAADAGLLATLMQWAQTIARVFEWLLWTLLAGFIAALLFYARDGLLQRSRREAARRATSVELATLPPAPDGEAAAAPSRTQLAACWAAGRQREAMALLYRLAVARLLGSTGASLAPGATESELLALAERAAPDGYRESFARLLEAWLGTAYADRVPDEACFRTLLDEFLGGAVGEAVGEADP